MTKRIVYTVHEAKKPSKLAYRQEFADKIVLFWGEGLTEAIRQWGVATELFIEPTISVEMRVGTNMNLAVALPLRDPELFKRMEKFNTFAVEFFGDENASKALDLEVGSSKI